MYWCWWGLNASAIQGQRRRRSSSSYVVVVVTTSSSRRRCRHDDVVIVIIIIRVAQLHIKTYRRFDTAECWPALSHFSRHLYVCSAWSVERGLMRLTSRSRSNLLSVLLTYLKVTRKVKYNHWISVYSLLIIWSFFTNYTWLSWYFNFSLLKFNYDDDVDDNNDKSSSSYIWIWGTKEYVYVQLTLQGYCVTVGKYRKNSIRPWTIISAITAAVRSQTSTSTWR